MEIVLRPDLSSHTGSTCGFSSWHLGCICLRFAQVTPGPVSINDPPRWNIFGTLTRCMDAEPLNPWIHLSGFFHVAPGHLRTVPACFLAFERGQTPASHQLMLRPDKPAYPFWLDTYGSAIPAFSTLVLSVSIFSISSRRVLRRFSLDMGSGWV